MKKIIALLVGGMLGLTGAMAQGGGDPAIAMGGRAVQGVVTAIAPDKLTLKTQTGDVFEVITSANTTVRKDRQPIKLADVHVGDGAAAMGNVDAPSKTVHALYLMVVDAEQVKKAQENLGKTYITGKVTRIDELKLTVMRPDGVAQVIAVDEDTSFKRGGRAMSMMGGGGGALGGGGAGGQRQGGDPAAAAGGESITLADVKVGDTVMGQGGLKSGVFVPKQLMVADAASAGQRHRREQTPGAPGAAGATGEPK